MKTIKCSNCGRLYPDEGTPYRCTTCGGLFDFATLPPFDPERKGRGQNGIWRYRHTLRLPENAPEITLGEGNTPLLTAEAFGKEVAFKCEYLNPSGSFKDRGSAAIASFLKARGVNVAVEDSSGNAGASFAAYAARAGITARVYVPEAASGPKRQQIEVYGAEVISVPGPRSNAADAVRAAVDAGAVYASHAYLPFNIPGYATAAYEIFEQLGQFPGSLVVPAGQGGLTLGLRRGFDALMAATGKTSGGPRIFAVQARACAPLWAVSQYGAAGLGWVSEGATLAEGVRVSKPLRGDAVLAAVETSGGAFLAVDEEAILPGRDELARRGFYVEPTSAIVWDALRQVISDAPEPVVVVLTGSGLKSPV